MTVSASLVSPFPFRFAQALLRRLGLYYRLRASALYDLYWTFTDQRLMDDRRTELRFYTELLQGFRTGDLIFDIGANQGGKTDIFLRMGARVVAADPDEANARVLRQKFLTLRLRPKAVVVVPKAVSDREGLETMWIDAPGSTMNTLSRKWVQALRDDGTRFGAALEFSQTRTIRTTTLDRLIEVHGTPHFVKIDVEGFEPAVLRGMKRAVPYLSFEVNLPEFRAEGLECVARLAGIEANGRFNYAGDLGRGLVLPAWLPAEAFSAVLAECRETSIEVFWRTRTVAGV